jgi:hypothetical protein
MLQDRTLQKGKTGYLLGLVVLCSIASSALPGCPATIRGAHFDHPVPTPADLLVFAYGNSGTEPRGVVDRLALVLDASQSAASAATAPSVTSAGSGIASLQSPTSARSTTPTDTVHGLSRPGATEAGTGPGPTHARDRSQYRVNRGVTVADAHRVLKAAAGERLYALYLLALCRGVRRGELP